jgi:hypothetical protein
MTKHTDIKVPDGYFANLQERLLSIPEKQSPRRVHLAPYFAYAASLAVLALAGSFILRRTAVTEESSEEWSYVSYLAQSLDPDLTTYDGLTLEELVSYEEDY